ncbi:protease SohB [soil metagenome]
MPQAPLFTDRLLQDVSPELILFLGQAAIVLLVILGVVTGIIAIFSSFGGRARPSARLEAKSINDEWSERKRSLESFFLSKKEWKARMKADEEAEKKRVNAGTTKRRMWVLDFNGDVEASHVDSLRNEITAILDLVASQDSAKTDEVLLRLESPGGTVTGYGLAASQLARLRKAGIKLTIAIDEVAASGGYMMAVVGNYIIASPFAVIGSIGVIGSVPNVNRLLKRFDVDYLEVTAGEYKRPVSMMGPLTAEGVEKFAAQIQETHVLFRNHVQQYRPSLDVTKVATGDIWHGADGIALGLVDELATSDEYIDRARHTEDRDVIHLSWRPARSWRDRFEESVSLMISGVVEKTVSRSIERTLARLSR